jgi:hypothetical protein
MGVAQRRAKPRQFVTAARIRHGHFVTRPDSLQQVIRQLSENNDVLS